MEIILKKVNPTDKNVRGLINELDTYNLSLYSEKHCTLESPESLKENAYMVGAFVGSELIAIGGVKLIESYAEIKRMYVLKNYRRYGVAEKILIALEEYVLKNSIDCICIETGISHDLAIAFYKNKGYSEISNFGEYPINGISVFFQKIILKQ